MRSEDGRGPLWWANEFDNQDVIDLLRDKGVRNDLRDGSGKIPRCVVNPKSTSEWKQTRVGSALAIVSQLRVSSPVLSSGFDLAHTPQGFALRKVNSVRAKT